MTSEEAVQICGNLFANGADESNVAELFIEETLKKAAQRIAETDEAERGMTVKELKARAPGKSDDTCRSWLHDDITVIILDFRSSKVGTGSCPRAHYAKHNRNDNNATSTNDDNSKILLDISEFERLTCEKLGGKKPFRNERELDRCFNDLDKDGTGYVSLQAFEDYWGKGRRGVVKKKSTLNSFKKREKQRRDALQVLSTEIEKQKGDSVRHETNIQIMTLMNLFDGMNKRQLKILFDALDVDGNGTLDRDEIGRLLSQVLSKAVTSVVLDTVFSEMDADGGGDVDLNEFTGFFGVM